MSPCQVYVEQKEQDTESNDGALVVLVTESISRTASHLHPPDYRPVLAG